MSLIDIGANLAHDSFDADRDAVLERARAADVAQCIVTGSDADSNRDAIKLSQRFAGTCFATAGLHPHHAQDWSDATAESIRRAAADGQLVALGEMGLDFHRDLCPRATQITVFEAQLEIAVDCGLPVFLHQRGAHDSFVPILANVIDHLPAAVVHCFTDTHAALMDYLSHDCHIGITGWVCDERRGQPVADLLPAIPDNRLMIETDCPYLMPRNIRPRPKTRRNEPAFLPYVAEAVAAARAQTPADIAALTTANARAFFGL